MTVPAGADRGVAEFLFADHRVEHVAFQRHPLPERATSRVGGRGDLALGFARGGIKHFAGLVVSEVHVRGGGDQRIAMHHQGRGDFAAPQKGAVVTAERRQRIQPRFLALLERDVAKGFENPASRRHRHLGQGSIPRIGQELRQVRTARYCVLGDGVVVRAVIGMGPVVNPWGKRLGFLARAQQCFSFRAHHTQRLIDGDLLG